MIRGRYRLVDYVCMCVRMFAFHDKITTIRNIFCLYRLAPFAFFARAQPPSISATPRNTFERSSAVPFRCSWFYI